MKILIVHAHHEPNSFSSALANQAAKTLQSAGHTVVLSDLYRMRFNPVSDRRNFTSSKNPDYLKQQAEEAYATDVGGFAADVESEIVKLESADAVILSFPLWWFGVPAIMKGWFDRVLASGRVYGGAKLYENGLGKSVKRGLVLLTTGGGADVYGGLGVNPPLSTVLAPIQHGIFWFNGILPLDPFVAWSPARQSDDERKAVLESLERRLGTLFIEDPIRLPPLADFPSWGHDTKTRYLVVAAYKKTPDDRFRSLVSAEQAMIARWKKEGFLLDFSMAKPGDPNWRAFLKVRAANRQEVDVLLNELPLIDYLQFEVTELALPGLTGS